MEDHKLYSEKVDPYISNIPQHIIELMADSIIDVKTICAKHSEEDIPDPTTPDISVETKTYLKNTGSKKSRQNKARGRGKGKQPNQPECNTPKN